MPFIQEECEQEVVRRQIVTENLTPDPVSIPEDERPAGKAYWYKTYTYAPTDRLVIRITDYLSNAMRRSWGDGSIQKLENILPEVIVGVKLAAEDLLKRRLEREAWHRAYEKRLRRRAELEKRVKVEKERRNQMETEILDWRKAAEIRRFCDDLQQKMQHSPEEYPAELVKRWILWARALASKYDPFENGYLQAALKYEGLDPDLG